MQWFLRRKSNVQGPFATEEIGHMLETGAVSRVTLAAPDGADFHPLGDWPQFAASAPRGAARPEAEQAAAAPPDDDASTEILGAAPEVSDTDRTRTMVRGSEGDFIAAAGPTVDERKTALSGTATADDSSAPPADRRAWPGAQQVEPGAGAAPPAAAPPPPEVGSAPSHSTPAAPPDEGRSLEYVPAPRLPPVRSGLGAWWAVVALLCLLLVAVGGAYAADRLLFGPTSNLSGYLPAGADWYVEVPSLERAARALQKAKFVDIEGANLEQVLDELLDDFPGTSLENERRVLESVQAVALASLQDELLWAVQYGDELSIDEFLAEAEDVQPGSEGTEYRRGKRIHCLWLKQPRVELCGGKAALAEAKQVLAGKAPGADQDEHLSVAKERRLVSYLPFVDVPAVLAVANNQAFADVPGLSTLGRVTLTTTIGEAGLNDKLDLVWLEGEAPKILSAPGKLTLFDELPATTALYVAYRARMPSVDEMQEALSDLDLPEGAPRFADLDAEFQRTVGISPSRLSEGLGTEGVVALCLAPGKPIKEDERGIPEVALWWVQTVTDQAEVQATIDSVVAHLAQHSEIKFRSKDDVTLVANAPRRLRFVVRVLESRLQIVLGHPDEVERSLAITDSLASDRAHHRAISSLGDDISALLWVDTARFIEDRTFVSKNAGKGSSKPPRWVDAIVTSGDDRLTSAIGMRQFDTGAVRIRAHNFPLVPLAAGTLAWQKAMGGPANGQIDWPGKPSDTEPPRDPTFRVPFDDEPPLSTDAGRLSASPDGGDTSP